MPLTGDSSFLLHTVQNALLISISFALLPLSSFILACSYAIRLIYEPAALRTRRQHRAQPKHIFEPRTVLVSYHHLRNFSLGDPEEQADASTEQSISALVMALIFLPGHWCWHEQRARIGKELLSSRSQCRWRGL